MTAEELKMNLEKATDYELGQILTSLVIKRALCDFVLNCTLIITEGFVIDTGELQIIDLERKETTSLNEFTAILIDQWAVERYYNY